MKSEVLHSLIYLWFIPGSPEILSVETDRHRACQITAISPLLEWESFRLSPGCSDTLWNPQGTEPQAGWGEQTTSSMPWPPQHLKAERPPSMLLELWCFTYMAQKAVTCPKEKGVRRTVPLSRSVVIYPQKHNVSARDIRKRALHPFCRRQKRWVL